MDVRTQVRSAARCNARREAVAAGDRHLTFAEAWECACAWPTGFWRWG